ncbi:uncharacterized protein LOC105429276 [Pogonomyrmex barbatus]|uniref:Uncharacterized protein LOC105429276 n=1 Tax=Pogonomyrmex barbatus TaxID=144034 RepID=A0A6I9WH19_9HYME|nr:uncharacterized protein LOC105429276 [Pogonomyrmex barbatus]
MSPLNNVDNGDAPLIRLTDREVSIEPETYNLLLKSFCLRKIVDEFIYVQDGQDALGLRKSYCQLCFHAMRHPPGFLRFSNWHSIYIFIGVVHLHCKIRCNMCNKHLIYAGEAVKCEECVEEFVENSDNKLLERYGELMVISHLYDESLDR